MIRHLLAGALLVALVGSGGINKAAAQTEPYIGQIAYFAFSFCPADLWLPADGRQLAVNQFQALYSLIGNIYGGTQNQNFNVPDLRGRAPVGVGAGTGIAPVQLASKFGQQVVNPEIINPAGSYSAEVTGQVQSSPSPGPYGYASGVVTVVLQENNLPAHTHALRATSGPNSVNTPGGNLLATYAAGAKVYSAAGAPSDVTMSTQAIGPTGNGDPVQVPVSLPVTSLNIRGTPVTGSTSGGVSINPAAISVATQSPAIGLTACIAVNGIYPQRP